MKKTPPPKRRSKDRSSRLGPDKAIRLSRSGLHEQAAERLRGLIVRGELAPGTVLNETELSEALGVSRTPLREALKLLAAEHLVELRLNRSATVSALRQDEIEELFEAAGGIERLAAELAAARMSAADLERLAELQADMERLHENGRRGEYFAINHATHAFIVSCAGNGALKAAHDWLLSRVERARFFALSSQPRWDESVREHRLILEALERRDGEAAGKLLDRHVRRTGEVVSEALEEKAEDPAPRRASAGRSKAARTAEEIS